MGDMTKKGSSFVNNETIGLFLAIVIAIIIINVFFEIFAIGYSVTDETLESYSAGLERSFREVEKYDIAEFSPLPSSEPGKHYFLVYFGNKNAYPDVQYLKATETDKAGVAIRSLPLLIPGAGWAGWGLRGGLLAASHGDTEGYDRSTTFITRFNTDFFIKRKTSNTLCVCHTDIDLKQQEGEVLEGYDGYRVKTYYTESECKECQDLDWPVRVHNVDEMMPLDAPQVFDIEYYNFLLKKSVDEDQKTIYIMEVQRHGMGEQ